MKKHLSEFRKKTTQRFHRIDPRSRRVFFATLLFFLVLCAIVIFILRISAPKEDLLFASTAYDVETGGATSVIHLSDVKIERLPIRGEGCDGFAKDQRFGVIRIACRFGKDRFMAYDPHSGKLTKTELTTPEFPTFRAPLVCAMTGKCFYGFGFMSTTEGSRGRIVVTQNGMVVKTVFLPDAPEHMIPASLHIASDTIFVLAKGESGHPSFIYRFDMNKEEFEGIPIKLGAEAWDIAVSGNTIAASVFRTTSGADVFIVDAVTGERILSLAVPGTWPSWNAFGVALSDEMLYVSGVGGVTAFTRSDWKQVANFPTPDFAVQAVVGGDSVFITVPNAQKIYELKGKTLEPVRTIDIQVGFGAIFFTK